MSPKTRNLLTAGLAVFFAILFLLFGNRSVNTNPSPSVTASSLRTLSVSPASIPTRTASPAATPSISRRILLDVPFTAQAPFGEWSDPRQQDGCEEASSVMAVRWAKGLGGLSLQQYKDMILTISKYEEEQYGSYHDTSAEDTVARIIKGYFKHDNAKVVNDIDAEDIINQLQSGNVVIVPANGQKLNNPHFTSPGPERHMLVVIGYDPTSEEFITNDPGTRFGKGYRYKKDILINAVADYETGYHEPITLREKVMIVVSK